MKKQLVTKLEKEIECYINCCNTEEAALLRNAIYIEMSPFIKIWLLSNLSKKGVFLEKEEITSNSWDCFLFCLKHYKPKCKIPIPNHFYFYTKYYVLSLQKNKEFEKENNDCELESSYDCIDVVYNQIDELKRFREEVENRLGKNYAFVFDDALLSLVPNNKDKTYRKESGLPTLKYQESKKIFKMFIDFIIRK